MKMPLLQTAVLAVTAYAISVTLRAATGHETVLPPNPNSAKECAICHFRWMPVFLATGQGTEVAGMPSEPVVATSEMCLSCHDGSVRDARRRFLPGYGHAVGKKPPKTMTIPEQFPLDANGRLQCATCHSPHSLKHTPEESGTLFLRVANKQSALCLQCHSDKADERQLGHHPLGRVGQPALSADWATATNRPASVEAIWCETCHNAHGLQQQGLLVRSVENGALCLACHPDADPIGPDGKRQAAHVINVPPQTARIPPAIVESGARLSHSGRLTCITCHKVHHGPASRFLLAVPTPDRSAFCLLCHPEKDSVAGTRHHITGSALPQAQPLETNLWTRGLCVPCHQAHSPTRRSITYNDATTEQCLHCHGAGGTAPSAKLTGYMHPINVTMRKVDESGAELETDRPSLPLFDNLGCRSPSGTVRCTSCHDPHVESASGTDEKKFLRRSRASLCVECHQDEAAVLYTKHDLRRAATRWKNRFGESPWESGPCQSCHAVHAADTSPWAISGVSPDRPSSFCLACHGDQGAAQQKIDLSRGHPVDVAVCGEEVAEALPLYNGWQRGPEGGLMTCLTCHDPHASGCKPPSGQEPTGFLRLGVAPVPDLCGGCHSNQVQVVGTKHDLSAFYPSATNVLGQTAAQTGPCGVCHVVHNSPHRDKLWARELYALAAVRGPIEAMCMDCHSGPGPAEKEIPAASFHPAVTPVGRPINPEGDRVDFPYSAPGTSQRTKAGIISCASCHDVHRWSPAPKEPGAKEPDEGDTRNAFLRGRSERLPCHDCHGPDGLYRYQYFHKPEAHRLETRTR